ncbi:MAG: PA14 domain-containing protein, partial [Anaerolineae bacterium]|nr:PA14 domain-containing protein [Anaerolineae bacterium]
MIYLWNKFNGGLMTIKKLPIIILLAVSLIVLLSFITGCRTIWERTSQAQLLDPDTAIPAITLEPAAGMVNTPVTIFGRGWSPDSSVLIYLAASDETEIPGYAVASAIADAEGRFNVTVVIPADSRWESSALVKVIARTADEQATTQVFFSIVDLLNQLTGTPTTLTEPTITPTRIVQETVPTPRPGQPGVTATTALNIRSGPGANFSVLGLLQAGQTAEVTGISPDGNWWQINYNGRGGERGWVSAKYVTAQNTGNVSVVQPPALPPAPAAQSGSIIITDWRAEYYNNLNLSGAPAVLRNDVVVNFDWGESAPASGIGVDNFSARWTRRLNFPAGTYRFYTRVDDGVRLWIDGNLVIDRWFDTAPTTYSADVTLTDGLHSLRIEYYDRAGSAVAQLAWEWLEAYPDWRGEYFNNPNLSGVPVLVRNDAMPKFSWGPSSPGPGIPADYFSVRWSRDLYFSAGTYRFKVSVDDGARLWVDDNLIIDQWQVGVPRTFRSEITLTEGFHRIRLEYFDAYYDAQVHLDWERLSTNFPDWKAEYFNNRKLEGNPTLVRNETQIKNDWGTGSPAAGLPADNFSARWTRQANFQSGTYLLRVKVDDGVRLWFDDVLLIDSWRDGGLRTLEAERQVSEGQHRLKVEYYERHGQARIEMTWQKKDVPANQSPQAHAGGPYTIDEGSLVTLDGQGSRDFDGNIVSYEWDFDHKNGVFTIDALGPTAGTRYPDGPASITVALRVMDDKGASHVATTQVTVKNSAPAVEAGGPYVGQVGSPITLAGTATDPGVIDQTGLSYRW